MRHSAAPRAAGAGLEAGENRPAFQAGCATSAPEFHAEAGTTLSGWGYAVRCATAQPRAG